MHMYIQKAGLRFLIFFMFVPAGPQDFLSVLRLTGKLTTRDVSRIWKSITLPLASCNSAATASDSLHLKKSVVGLTRWILKIWKNLKRKDQN